MRAGRNHVRIGGAAGFWGDSALGPRQLLDGGDLDYLVFDYLAELTMSLLAAARRKHPELGYATDFIDVMRDVLADALARGVRIVANAGGINPQGCAAALRALAAEQGLAPRIAVVEGDDVSALLPGLRAEGLPLPATVLSANAYLGALPVKAALDSGADVVITGRCVDSAVTLGALMHEFGWAAGDYDLLAAGSLAGHLIECGCQGSGGLFTDWEDVPDWANSGYPVVECRADGSFVLGKPESSGGLVSPAAAAEQLLYEIGDPAHYLLPDVVCDFTGVTLEPAGPQRVLVQGARGRAPTPTYKVSATYADGFRSAAQLTIVGHDAGRKARRSAEAILTRTRAMFARAGLADYSATHIDILGAQEGFGQAVMWLAVAHPQRAALESFTREIAPAGTSWAPGTTGFGGRPSVSPAIKQFSFLLDKNRIQPVVHLPDGEQARPAIPPGTAATAEPVSHLGVAPRGEGVTRALPREGWRMVPLIELAWARSGDKGDTSNIGVIARHPGDLPLLREQLTPEAVAAHLADKVSGPVTRYELPGIHAFNFVCEQALGGGGMASLRHDPLGKGMAQWLLAMPVAVPPDFTSRRT
ncbi:acyclic terpene utilization AtuA family protein [Duganella sp. Root336D2]|uniref:acyclic terpene utilization AtuA family protein n=1 Tax=Duganella sp. Root336D2 TaxID=1736518 RepID=UPI0006F9C4C0|nr:acyclic terpene utilization AtuA family protein [Duganella sp. Root336D2]KQV51020.1 terpene utilization protein AtuA [Duganella sp. Root336D2]